MKIIVIGYFNFKIYEEAVCLGFESLGHDVHKIKFSNFFNYDNILDKFYFGLQKKLICGPKINMINNLIVNKVKKINPDFIFIYRGELIKSYTIKLLKNKTKIISYHNDDPFRSIVSRKILYRNYIKFLELCDINYVYRSKNIKDINNIGLSNCKLLLPSYRTHFNYYIPIEKDIDVCFIGHFENDGRDMKILHLIKNGIDVKIYGGKTWKKSKIYDKLKYNLYNPVYEEDYNLTLNRSKIALVFLSKLNNDNYTRRNFEITACKTFMLSEYSDFLSDIFVDGIHCGFFEKKEELLDKIIVYLENQKLREEIEKNGYIKILELKSSTFDRCKTIIQDVKKLS